MNPLRVILLLILPATAIIFEAASFRPHFVQETATVRKVVPDTEWGFIGEDSRTLARFKDGFTTAVGGDLGEPGDQILVTRQRGTRSLFGILGDQR